MTQLRNRLFNISNLYAVILLIGLLLLGFSSCRTKPKTKYGPPSDYRTAEKIK